jgi:hypothetical protein
VSLTQVTAALESRVDVLSAEVLRRVWGTPGYDEQHMARTELASYLEPNMRAIVRSLSEAEDPPPHAVAAAERIGEARALQGVPVDAVMQSWAIAERVVLDHLLREAERLPGAELRTAVGRLGAVVDGLTRRSIEAYRRTQEEVTTHYDRLATDLVARLTGEQPADPDEVRRRARTIGVDPSTPYAALTVAVDGGGRAAGAEAYLRAQRHLLAVVARSQGRVLIGSVDEYPLLLVPAPAGSGPLAAALTAALADPRRPDPMVVGVSEQVAQLPATGPVCQEARDALEVARRQGARDRVVRFRDVAPEVLLVRNPDVASVLRAGIGPLLGRPDLLETLRVYLQSGLSARETSRRLYVHPNTVPYRLRVIERLLDRKLVDVVAMADLVLALRSPEPTTSRASA